MSQAARRQSLEAMIAIDGATGQYQCQVCKKLAPRKTAIFNHFEAIHLRAAAYKCHQCSKTFTNMDTRYRHMVRAHKSTKPNILTKKHSSRKLRNNCSPEEDDASGQAIIEVRNVNVKTEAADLPDDPLNL